MGLDVVNEPILVFAHLEKIVGFLYDLRFHPMVRAFSVNQFPFLVKTFTSKAVYTFVTGKIDITAIMDLCQYGLDNLDVIGIGCPDKLIIVNVQQGQKILKQLADPVGIDLGRCVILFSRLDNFIPVFICSC